MGEMRRAIEAAIISAVRLAGDDIHILVAVGGGNVALTTMIWKEDRRAMTIYLAANTLTSIRVGGRMPLVRRRS